MLLSDYHFDLPESSIAQYPVANRSSSRLLCMDQAGNLQHHIFSDVINQLEPNDLLVLNNTKVIPARLFANKSSGGRVEILVERVLDSHIVIAHCRASKPLKINSVVTTLSGHEFQVMEKQETLFRLQALNASVTDILQQDGHTPLPPYIQREDALEDRERFQTVYAKNPGAVAAPTAGLHFDDALLQAIREKGIRTVYLTLHVGAGTFMPIRTDDPREHVMHHEVIEVDETVVAAVKETHERGGRVVAVGTTVVRSLESAAREGELKPLKGETNIFIYPGFTFRVVDALITNFHLPQSTLLLLVSAFAGRENILSAYQTAVKEGYRFFSYGDAMFLSRLTQ